MSLCQCVGLVGKKASNRKQTLSLPRPILSPLSLSVYCSRQGKSCHYYLACGKFESLLLWRICLMAQAFLPGQTLCIPTLTHRQKLLLASWKAPIAYEEESITSVHHHTDHRLSESQTARRGGGGRLREGAAHKHTLS